MQVTGTTGVVKVGPHEAASVVSWSLASSAPKQYTFTAQAGSVDRFWITQQPQDLRLNVGTRTWVWRGVTLEIAGDRLTATLPRPEVK
jgi:hypothetical protein